MASVVSGAGDVRHMVQAVKLSAYDFLTNRDPAAILGDSRRLVLLNAFALQDALPPVGHTVDFVPVEEDVQFASLHSFKRGEVLLDALDEFGDAALRIVAARVGNKEVVKHGKVICCHRLYSCRTIWLRR